MIPARKTASVFHGTRVYYAEGWEGPLKELGIHASTEWAALAPGQRVRASSITSCFRIPLGDGSAVYFKRYVYHRMRLGFYYPAPSKAAVECFGYHHLRRLDIPAPEVLALGEARRYGALRAALIVTREVPAAMSLDRFAREVWYPMPEPQRSKVYHQISAALMDQVKQAHRARFFHRDLKWRNILVASSEGGYRTVWIDCPRAAFMHLRPRRGALVDLGGLSRLALSYLSVYERARWLRDYLGRERETHAVKRLYRRVQAYVDRRPPRILELTRHDDRASASESRGNTSGPNE